MQKLITNKRAQALIEFVLVLPILIMLLFSIIDFGTILIRKSELENKINEAYEAAKNMDQNYMKMLKRPLMKMEKII
jgi:Flp pilus assembly protein TadG